VFSPGCNELDLYSHRAGKDFTETSPGCYETRKDHQVWNEYHDISPGRSELSGTFTGLE
jgi:hypothetical protein